MAEKKYHPCSKKGFCISLKRVTQASMNGEPKGLSFITVMTKGAVIGFETIGVVYRMKNKDNGTLLNYCPFCGEDLRPLREGYFKKKEE